MNDAERILITVLVALGVSVVVTLIMLHSRSQEHFTAPSDGHLCNDDWCCMKPPTGTYQRGKVPDILGDGNMVNYSDPICGPKSTYTCWSDNNEWMNNNPEQDCTGAPGGGNTYFKDGGANLTMTHDRMAYNKKCHTNKAKHRRNIKIVDTDSITECANHDFLKPYKEREVGVDAITFYPNEENCVEVDGKRICELNAPGKCQIHSECAKLRNTPNEFNDEGFGPGVTSGINYAAHRDWR